MCGVDGAAAGRHHVINAGATEPGAAVGEAGDVSAGRVDFFISHAGADRAWAEWVASQLTEAGHSVELDVRDWIAGQNCITKISETLGRADRVGALWSAEYFSPARYTTHEWSAVLTDGREAGWCRCGSRMCPPARCRRSCGRCCTGTCSALRKTRPAGYSWKPFPAWPGPAGNLPTPGREPPGRDPQGSGLPGSEPRRRPARVPRIRDCRGRCRGHGMRLPATWGSPGGTCYC